MPEEKNIFDGKASVKRVPPFAHELRWGQRVLLVGGSEFKRSLRASILRAHGLQVEMAATLAEGRSLVQPNTFDWILLDVHSELPGEVIDFCERVGHVAPGRRIAFFVGPPAYVSLKWPGEAIAEDKGEEPRATALKAAA
ncbi:MAG: hypothetical protein LAO22_21740 [Acidobacteriia bacterium]|nr:hypothetical protein [Terriglobia bacterium]